MKTKAEWVLKDMELDYNIIVENLAFSIKPKDFMADMVIVLIIKGADKYEMFIWSQGEILKSVEFKEYGSICDMYSFLYNYKVKDFGSKTKSIRK